MKKRVIAILMLAVMLLGALAGCNNNEPMTDEEAKELVREHIEAEGKKVTEIHSHIGETADGQVCFNVYVTVRDKSYTYQVHAVTGEILSVTEGGHSH